ncbi:MAG: glycosyltransferase family 2 protein [Peptococcaceae bacterium]|nr:glycosyltransferase family 2 protein [Peptococcaceae bacterium]
MVTISEAVILFVLMYYYCVSVFGWKKHKEEKDYTPTKKFALVTAAHNEEAVIRYHIESLKKLNYPAELYDIYIIADNCTDNTASVARQEGVYVFERYSKLRGKGYALEWMFNELHKMEDKQYDAVCVFDADNVVSSNFLLEMNAKLKQGYLSIQGYLDTKNPNDSWVTACYATAYWSMNRMWQLARYNLGLSNALGGTGLCLDYSTLKKYGWGATCLTEDLEFTMKLLLNGVKTSWAHDCKVYDEKPVLFSQTWRQRTRWLQGHWDVALRYMIPLLKKGIKERKWYLIDGAIYLFQPFLIMTMLFNIAITFVASFFPEPIYASPINAMMPGWFWVLFGVLGYCYPMLGLYLEGAPRKAYYYYITYPIYGLTWFPVTLVGLIKHGNQSEWAHTLHTRGISITSLE